MKTRIYNSSELEILSEFHHNQRYYIIFTRDNCNSTFLFFQHSNEYLFSLVYGDFTLERIKEIQKSYPSDCIECKMGLEFEGGISQDGQSVASFGLNSGDANKTIDILQVLIKNQLDLNHFSDE